MQGKLRELLSLVGDAPEAAEKRRAVLDQYGGWLSEKHMQEDAAVAFLAAGNLEAALEQYKEGNHWRMALSVAGMLPHLTPMLMTNCSAGQGGLKRGSIEGARQVCPWNTDVLNTYT